jgi:hypothetical protein
MISRVGHASIVCKPRGHLTIFALTRATNQWIRCMHCTHSTFSPCCAPIRATNPAIRCIAWGIFPIFALTRATNPAIHCIAWGIFLVFTTTRAQNRPIVCAPGDWLSAGCDFNVFWEPQFSLPRLKVVAENAFEPKCI